jgi:hypothetical protein
MAVYLNRKLCRRAVKVEDIFSSRMLSPILETAGSFTQLAPQYRLGEAHLDAQLSGAFERVGGAGYHLACPSTMLRMVPLPVSGRIG